MKQVMTMIIVSCLMSSQALATLAVIDSANLAKSAEQITALGQQLAAMKAQLEQTKEQYTTITGNRGLGSLLYNQDLYKVLPEIAPANSKAYDLAGILAEIASREQLTGSIKEIQNKIIQRQRQSSLTNKAVSLAAYQAAVSRLEQIEALMHQISKTQDLKAINEVQARIAIEQTAIQNEITKLQMLSELQLAEQRLIQEQRRETSRRILNSNNTSTPRIK